MLAANVDVAFLVQALPLDFNVRRLERYLAMAWESGAQPVVLLTKTDLVDDVAAVPRRGRDGHARRVPGRTPSRRRPARGSTSCCTWFEGNRTAVLLGSSGVGKSTIVNALAGEELLATQEVREDDQRGRHTTTHRELILLPSGGVVLDTPGIRELQLWDADLEQTFGDIEEIARRCRFSDCAHDQEPGCAIREALADGSLPRRALGELPQAAARAGGDRGPPQPPTATGTRPRVQNPRTSAEADRRRSADPAPRPRGRGRVRAARSRAPLRRRCVLGQEVARPRPGPPFAWADGAWRLRFARPDARPARVPDRRRRRVRARPGATRCARAGPFGDKSVVEWPEYAPPAWLDSIADAGPVERDRAALPPARRARPGAALLDARAARRATRR